MAWHGGQVFSLPRATVFSLPHGLAHGPPMPPVITHRKLITEAANIAPTGPSFPLVAESGDQLVTEQA